MGVVVALSRFLGPLVLAQIPPAPADTDGALTRSGS